MNKIWLLPSVFFFSFFRKTYKGVSDPRKEVDLECSGNIKKRAASAWGAQSREP